MTLETPPRWAEIVLRAVLSRESRDAVSGDLLEEYRAVMVPERGQRRANVWYIAQVGGYLLRHSGAWAVLFSGAFLARQAYDWFVPTTDFALRAEISTYVAMSLVLAAGFSAAWRSGSTLAGPLAGFATTTVAAAISIVGASLLLAVWHDPATMAALRGSGGVEELFTLPVMVIVPGIMLGLVGGAVGAAARQIRRITTG